MGQVNIKKGFSMLHSRKHQQGISLYIVIVIVLLSTLLALWSSRTSIFNEMIVGNDADYQRAYEAAQAMIEDAKKDIQFANSLECIINTCRSKIAGTIPTTMPSDSIADLINDVDGQDTKCLHGVCLKRMEAQDFWRNPTTMKAMTEGKKSDNDNIGVRYGDYTGARSDTTSNQILQKRGVQDEGAWYWIEVMNYEAPSDVISGPSSAEIHTNLIYRITAIAYGMKTSDNKPITQVVLQSIVLMDTGSGEEL